MSRFGNKFRRPKLDLAPMLPLLPPLLPVCKLKSNLKKNILNTLNRDSLTYFVAASGGNIAKLFCRKSDAQRQAEWLMNILFLFLFKWTISGLFFLFVFSIQLTVNVQYNFLSMTGFELRTSGIGSNHSTNWATTTAQTYFLFLANGVNEGPAWSYKTQKARKVIQLYINSKVHDALNVQLSLVSIGLELYQLIGQELYQLGGVKTRAKKKSWIESNRAVVVAQLVEQLLPSPEICSLNPVIGNLINDQPF